MVGKKYDTGKTRWDLIEWSVMKEVADVLTRGAVKYGDRNWKAVPDAKRRYIAAAFRHFIAWIGGERNDKETGLHHLAHAICCLMFLLEKD